MIELMNIEKHYDLGEMEVKALDGISLTINRGDFVAVMGPSGSGKSTLMNIVGLLDSSTGGTYKLEGYEIHDLSDKEQARIRNQHFGFIFQSFNLFPELNALENVMLPMSYAGLSLNERKTRAGELLEQVGLSHRLYHYPTMMSGGEQQRVAIARALSNRPDLIIADEPTGNLPSNKGREIMDTLINLNREGVTIMMVTHNDDQGAMAHKQIHIRDGHVAQVREGALA